MAKITGNTVKNYGFPLLRGCLVPIDKNGFHSEKCICSSISNDKIVAGIIRIIPGAISFHSLYQNESRNVVGTIVIFVIIHILEDFNVLD